MRFIRCYGSAKRTGTSYADGVTIGCSARPETRGLQFDRYGCPHEDMTRFWAEFSTVWRTDAGLAPPRSRFRSEVATTLASTPWCRAARSAKKARSGFPAGPTSSSRSRPPRRSTAIYRAKFCDEMRKEAFLARFRRACGRKPGWSIHEPSGMESGHCSTSRPTGGDQRSAISSRLGQRRPRRLGTGYVCVSPFKFPALAADERHRRRVAGLRQ